MLLIGTVVQQGNERRKERGERGEWGESGREREEGGERRRGRGGEGERCLLLFLLLFSEKVINILLIKSLAELNLDLVAALHSACQSR